VINIEGKSVYTELHELVDPRHTALLLVDMQRDFVEPDGVFGSLGIDLSMYTETRPCGCRKLHPCLVTCRPSRTADDRRTDAPGWSIVLLPLPYLALTRVFTFMRLLPMSDTDKDIEILTLRHQLAIVQRRSHNAAGSCSIG
jgi:hypothetical protein